MLKIFCVFNFCAHWWVWKFFNNENFPLYLVLNFASNLMDLCSKIVCDHTDFWYILNCAQLAIYFHKVTQHTHEQCLSFYVTFLTRWTFFITLLIQLYNRSLLLHILALNNNTLPIFIYNWVAVFVPWCSRLSILISPPWIQRCWKTLLVKRSYQWDLLK